MHKSPSDSTGSKKRKIHLVDTHAKSNQSSQHNCHASNTLAPGVACKFHWTATPYDNCFRSRTVWLKQANSRIEYKVGDPSKKKKKDKRNTTHIHETAWVKSSKQPYLTALGLWTPPVCCASVFSQLAFRLHFRSGIPYISNICSSKAGRP